MLFVPSGGIFFFAQSLHNYLVRRIMVDIICYCKGNKRFGSLGCSVLHLRDLRLITLQGVIHKVLAQVLARRLNYGESTIFEDI